MTNQTMIQYFEWDLPSDGILWRRAAAQAKSLRSFGFDIIWLPPAYKGANGASDVGYAVYDLYDLGEFDQKGSVRTKYGTKDEYVGCVQALHAEGISVIADIVLNHRIGADGTEQVMAEEFSADNRLKQLTGEESIEAWTRYTFPGRGGKYSDFKWDWSCFSGADWDAKKNKGGIYQFEGKRWSNEVDDEKGNFDYLMGADVDMNNPAVVKELIRWGEWYVQTTGVDGFRLDAIKHIDFDFFEKWLDAVRAKSGKDDFAVGEYWSAELADLLAYLENTGRRMSLFDVPLHYNFYNASNSGGNFGMQNLLKGTLVQSDIFKAVTFVDNHDSQPGQSLQSWVQPWFKPLAYATILLRRDGLPCVFYADYYGLRSDGVPPVPGLRRMLAARRDCAYGEQHDYFDHENVVGWTREGDAQKTDSGCAVLMSDGPSGEKRMYVGKHHAGEEFRDITRRIPQPVRIEGDGWANFAVEGGSVSVYVSQNAYENIAVHCE